MLAFISLGGESRFLLAAGPNHREWNSKFNIYDDKSKLVKRVETVTGRLLFFPVRFSWVSRKRLRGLEYLRPSSFFWLGWLWGQKHMSSFRPLLRLRIRRFHNPWTCPTRSYSLCLRPSFCLRFTKHLRDVFSFSKSLARARSLSRCFSSYCL